MQENYKHNFIYIQTKNNQTIVTTSLSHTIVLHLNVGPNASQDSIFEINCAKKIHTKTAFNLVFTIFRDIC